MRAIAASPSWSTTRSEAPPHDPFGSASLRAVSSGPASRGGCAPKMSTLFAPIVVADDDAVGRELVSRVLEKAGHRTVTAPDGARAWELIQSVKPALAVLDWDMPHLTGLDVLRRVKLTIDRTPPYVLLLTSRTEVRDRVRGLTVGAD